MVLCTINHKDTVVSVKALLCDDSGHLIFEWGKLWPMTPTSEDVFHQPTDPSSLPATLLLQLSCSPRLAWRNGRPSIWFSILVLGFHSCFHKEPDLYFNSTYVFFSEPPVFISGYSLHPSSQYITVLFPTICCKELICQRDKIFKDIEEGVHQHCFRPTTFCWRGARGQLAMKNMAGFFK